MLAGLDLGLAEGGALLLMRSQPVQVAIAQLRPACGKGQKVAALQALLARDGFGGGVHAGAALASVVGGLVAQVFMKALQHRMQPVAKVALVHLGVQLIGLAQAQLALGEEAVGAVAQVGICGRRKLLHGQRLPEWLAT